MDAPDDIANLVNMELTRIQDRDLVQCIRDHLVTPYSIVGRWQYGVPGQTYPCWVVLEEKSSDIVVVFCEFGFAPSYPWGIIVLTDKEMGMDCNWHVSLEHAVRNCPLWQDKNPPDYEIP